MKNLYVLFTAILMICMFATSVEAQVPHLIRFQGKLTDNAGAPLNGNYDITFRIYDADIAGTLLWSESQPAVPVNQGIFTVLLGNVTVLNLPFDAPYWLSMEINTDGEMSPRQAITSVGYAYRAEVADSVSGGTAIPQGAIILWPDLYGDGSCPVGYTRVTALDGKFIVGGATYNAAAGGNNTHNHDGITGSHALTTAEIPAHTHTQNIATSESGGSIRQALGDGIADNSGSTSMNLATSSTGGGGGHTHTITNVDSRPEFATVILCEKN